MASKNTKEIAKNITRNGHIHVKNWDKDLEFSKRKREEQENVPKIEFLRGKVPDSQKHAYIINFGNPGKIIPAEEYWVFPSNLSKGDLVFASKPHIKQQERWDDTYVPRFSFEVESLNKIMGMQKTIINYNDGVFTREFDDGIRTSTAEFAMRRMSVINYEPCLTARDKANLDNPFLLGEISILTSMTNPYFWGIEYCVNVGGAANGKAILYRLNCGKREPAKLITPKLIETQFRKGRSKVETTEQFYWSLVPRKTFDADITEVPSLTNVRVEDALRYVLNELHIGNQIETNQNETNIVKLADMFSHGRGMESVEPEIFFVSKPTRQLERYEYKEADLRLVGDIAKPKEESYRW